ncbi:MAG: hypothetical protein MR034_09760, partial [Actinobacillus porcinus]|uniref:hypothetical protein n=1 Tax=Actinobacillus porcinus TaxID=51048 RepID=UPI0023572787
MAKYAFSNMLCCFVVRPVKKMACNFGKNTYTITPIALCENYKETKMSIEERVKKIIVEQL